MQGIFHFVLFAYGANDIAKATKKTSWRSFLQRFYIHGVSYLRAVFFVAFRNFYCHAFFACVDTCLSHSWSSDSRDFSLFDYTPKIFSLVLLRFARKFLHVKYLLMLEATQVVVFPCWGFEMRFRWNEKRFKSIFVLFWSLFWLVLANELQLVPTKWLSFKPFHVIEFNLVFGEHCSPRKFSE